MNILILDDNKEFANMLKHDLSNYLSGICDKSNFDVIIENFSCISFNKKYDIAFFDIDLFTVNGIELAKELKQKGLCNTIVFVSSYSHLVYDSLTAHPFFFMRKSQYKSDVKILFELLGDSFKQHIFITLKSQGRKNVIDLQDILYLESVEHILMVYTINGVFEDNRKLKVFLSEYKHENFVQIHKSCVINLNYLLNYSTNEVELAGNIHLVIGRTFKNSFLEQYQRFLVQ